MIAVALLVGVLKSLLQRTQFLHFITISINKKNFCFKPSQNVECWGLTMHQPLSIYSKYPIWLMLIQNQFCSFHILKCKSVIPLFSGLIFKFRK